MKEAAERVFCQAVIDAAERANVRFAMVKVGCEKVIIESYLNREICSISHFQFNDGREIPPNWLAEVVLVNFQLWCD